MIWLVNEVSFPLPSQSYASFVDAGKSAMLRVKCYMLNWCCLLLYECTLRESVKHYRSKGVSWSCKEANQSISGGRSMRHHQLHLGSSFSALVKISSSMTRERSLNDWNNGQRPATITAWRIETNLCTHHIPIEWDGEIFPQNKWFDHHFVCSILSRSLAHFMKSMSLVDEVGNGNDIRPLTDIQM